MKLPIFLLGGRINKMHRVRKNIERKYVPPEQIIENVWRI